MRKNASVCVYMDKESRTLMVVPWGYNLMNSPREINRVEFVSDPINSIVLGEKVLAHLNISRTEPLIEKTGAFSLNASGLKTYKQFNMRWIQATIGTVYTEPEKGISVVPWKSEKNGTGTGITDDSIVLPQDASPEKIGDAVIKVLEIAEKYIRKDK